VHWPPFLKAAVEYIKETYPDFQTSEKAQSLIAFIFAVSGHQVQDAAWHSIGLLMGFIEEVAKVDCHEDSGRAHEILDWGGDAILGKRYSGIKGSADWAFVSVFDWSLLTSG
jgi:glycosylphosphatidylinositol phospholipase D